MKALVYLGKEQLDYRDVPDPEEGEGIALVRVDACGICGSDMHGFHGYDPRRVPPLIMGHEGAGVVETGRLKGARVAINPLVSCKTCISCVSGQPQLCEKRQTIGLPPRSGAFADLVAVLEDNLVVIPDTLDFKTAALAEPVAVAYHAVNIGQRLIHRPLAATRALVLGGGAIGLATALVLLSRGVSEVFLAETNPARRKTAEAAGNISAYAPGEAHEPDAKTFDLVFDAVGAKATRMAAFDKVKMGGGIVHLGLLPGSEGVDVRALTLGEIAFSGSFCYTQADFIETVALLEKGRLGPLNWVEERAMRDGFMAFSDIDKERVSAAKIILRN